ncbi:MAG: two-component regulator propeller domain-containing protein, partial [Planctomycetota bacterium]
MQALLRRTLSAAWILLSLGSALARGQDGSPRLKRIGKREGLQGHEIRALLRDPNGMLWIGTEKALLRFDMYGCVSVEPGGSEAPEDGKLEVTSLELLEGRLWAGTKHGLYYFDPEQGLLHPARSLVQGAAEGLDLPVLSLTKDSRGRLWVGSRGGLGYIESRSFRPVVPEPSLLPERAHTTEVAFVSFLLDRERLWVGTENHGLLLLDLNMLRLSRHALRLASGKEAFMIGCMQRTGAGRLWVGSTDAGLLEYDPLDGSASAVELAAWKGRHWRSVVTAIAEDSDGRTWLGTAGNGVLVLPPERGDGIALKAAPDSRTSLPDNRIRILYRDDLGTLWIGSNRGVCVVDDRMGPFRNHEPSRSEEGPPGKDGYRTRVLSIWKDANGSVWVGTQGDGLQILDAGSGRYRRYGEGRGQARPLEVVSALLRDRAGVLWAGGYGLFRMDGDAFQRIELPERQRIPPPLRRNPKLGTWVKNMLEDRAGRLWVNNHFRVCVLSADRRSWKSYELEKPASNLVEDERGRIWAATMGAGLLEIDPGRQLQRYHKRDPRLTDGLPSDMLSYVARGHAGKFWFSCNKGFGSFEERTGKVQTYALTKSRIGSVHGIVEDGSNRLWLCAGKALYRFDPETAHVQVFDRFDFSRLGRFQKRTIHRARDGELFFGRERGITRVHPDACYARNPGPELRLGAVRILDRLLWPGDPELDGSRLTLAHDRSYLTFMVTDMDVFHTESRRFSFQLAGLDTRWMESEHASIH